MWVGVWTADLGCAITGIAGPSGGSPEKPVGTVYVCYMDGANDKVVRCEFTGGRGDVRGQTVMSVLAELKGMAKPQRA